MRTQTLGAPLYTLRTLHPENWREFSELWVEKALHDYPSVYWVTLSEARARTREEWMDLCTEVTDKRSDKPRRVAYGVYSDKGILFGSVEVFEPGKDRRWVSKLPGHDVGVLGRLFVDPNNMNYHRLPVARRMVSEAIDWARAAQFTMLVGAARDDNERAQRVFTQTGFVPLYHETGMEWPATGETDVSQTWYRLKLADIPKAAPR